MIAKIIAPGQITNRKVEFIRVFIGLVDLAMRCSHLPGMSCPDIACHYQVDLCGIAILSDFFSLLKISQDNPAKGNLIFVGLPEHNSQLGLTLYQLWEMQYPELLRNADAMSKYSLLVQYLVSIKNPLGIEIQSKMTIQ